MAGYSTLSLEDFQESLKHYWRINIKWNKEREEIQVLMSAKAVPDKVAIPNGASMEDAIVDKIMKQLAISNQGTLNAGPQDQEQGGQFRGRRTMKFCTNCNKRGHTIKECWDVGGGREGQ